MNYRIHLINTINILCDQLDDIFAQILHLSSFGVDAAILENFKENEEYDVVIGHFENSKDENVQALVALFKDLHQLIGNLIDNNNISENELELEFN